MFKLVLAIAIAAGSAATAQANDLAREDRSSSADAHYAQTAPRQMTGPAKIRFRQLSSLALPGIFTATAAQDERPDRRISGRPRID